MDMNPTGLVEVGLVEESRERQSGAVVRLIQVDDMWHTQEES